MSEQPGYKILKNGNPVIKQEEEPSMKKGLLQKMRL